MTDHKVHLIKYDDTRRIKIKVVDSRSLQVEEIGNMVIKRSYDRLVIIGDVLHVRV